MNPSKPGTPDIPHDEVAALIDTLIAVEARLDELTGGQVDTVSGRDGRTFLLRRAQENLRHGEAAKQAARDRRLLEAAPDAMVVVDQAGVIVLVNAQAETEFGYPRDELLGQQVSSLVPEGFAERLVAPARRPVEEALAQPIGAGIELSGRRRDGSAFPIELRFSRIRTSDGVLVTAAIRNITVRKAAEAQLHHALLDLKRSNQDLEQFAYIASHDLQEPLRIVASHTRLLAKRYKGRLDADADELLDFAVDGADRMQRLIQDLLAYSRVGTKGHALAPASSEKAFAQAVVNLSGAIGASGATVTHDALPAVLGDAGQITQLFQNLVGNAIKYQRGDPAVHVSAQRTGDLWTFSVKDNGIGIDPQHCGRIFGLFQRLHGRGEFSGSGIGLAICKKIVDRHGGTIRVESQPGQGSTFSFGLKTVEGDAPTSEETP